MSPAVPRLMGVVAALHDLYGDIATPVTAPFEMILLENVAYLVDDATRYDTFVRLRDEIGLAPEAILAHSAEEVAGVIAGGGMQPMMRAGKVLEAARIADRTGLQNLAEAVASNPKAAKRMLRQFPSIGEPYADRILLFAGSLVTIAPDSNALRVLGRLGFGREEGNYAAMYRSAIAATADQIRDPATARRAHLLLRRHGQELCKRSAPKCDLCPLRASCLWYAKVSSA